MKKTYNIEIDCANCANLVEAAISKLEGVREVSVSFMTQKMTLELDDSLDEKKFMKDLIKRCKKIEPDFSLEL